MRENSAERLWPLALSLKEKIEDAMRIVLFAYTVLAVASVSLAEAPLVTVNVNVVTNVVDDAKVAERAAAKKAAAKKAAAKKTAAEKAAAEKAAAEKAAAEAAAARAARIDAARKRSHAVIKQLIADMKPVPGKAYLLGRTEVTAEQWHAVMEPDVPFVGEAKLPVSGVSWNDCQEFIKRLNECREAKAEGVLFRLPTVKEWRHACLAGAKGNWGLVSPKKAGILDAMGWYAGNSGEHKYTVARKMPNAWGFVDMHGNVFEWCADTCPEYGGDFRVRVGGSFRATSEQCSGWFTNSANRQFSRYDDQGVRLLAERY